MNARSGLTSLLCLFLAGTCGCSSPKEWAVHEFVSPDGRTLVYVQWNPGSFGAAGNSSTVIFMRQRGWFLSRYGFYRRVAMIEKSPEVKPVWESNKLLTIRLTPKHGPYRVAWRKSSIAFGPGRAAAP